MNVCEEPQSFPSPFQIAYEWLGFLLICRVNVNVTIRFEWLTAFIRSWPFEKNAGYIARLHFVPCLRKACVLT